MYHYPFALHSRRINMITIISACILVVSGSIAIFAIFNILPSVFDGITVFTFIVAVIALTVLMPVLYFQFSYARSGVWIEPDKVRVRFPGEDQQELSWSEARFAIDEGEEYLQLSRGKEGLGHLVGDTRYIRLHLEGMKPEQRTQVKEALSRHVEVRTPRLFTLMSLLNPKGEVVARGRLYLFDHEVLCAENRGEKRVFFYAPLKELGAVEQRNSYYIGRMECDAFSIHYQKTEYRILLGYETTFSSSIGNSSSWSRTGIAEEWIEALKE